MKAAEFNAPTPEFTHLSQYETWATQNWLHQQGTIDAQLHARNKLDEEVVELQEAIATKDPENIISEGGDVLWTAHASGVNTGISPSNALSYLALGSDIPSKLIDEKAAQMFEGIQESKYISELTRSSNSVFKNTKQWFNLQHLVASDQPGSFSEAIILSKHHRAKIAIAQLVLLTSYGLQEYAHTGIESAMQDNYQKLEGRIAAGALVTKSARIHGVN